MRITSSHFEPYDPNPETKPSPFAHGTLKALYLKDSDWRDLKSLSLWRLLKRRFYLFRFFSLQVQFLIKGK